MHRLLAVRPRSRRELERRLRRRGYPEEAIREILARLEEVGLLDDGAFARQWVESRMLRGMGPDAVERELIRRFGVDPRQAREAVEAVYDGDTGYGRARARLEQWWRQLARDPRGRRKLFERAWRRGIPAAWVERFLQEIGEDGGDSAQR